jgi:glycosyltransferase involved in cell wall biosynthesis
MAAVINVLLLVENNGYPRDFRVRREAHALRDAGLTVSVICPREQAEPWTECYDGIHVYRFPAPPGGGGLFGYAFEFTYATAIILLLALWVALRRGVDVVHAANPPDSLFVIGAIFRLLGKRFVFDHHDLAPEVYLSRFGRNRHNLVYAALRVMERCSYAVADIVIATNESYRRRAIERGRMDASRVFVVRNGPPLSYQPIAPPPELASRTNQLVGYIGTIGPQDGLDYLMRIMGHVVHTLGRSDVELIVIGDGDALPGVKELAAELRIESRVRFTGWLTEKQACSYLSAVDVCVQPDPSGPLNDFSTMNKLMEYMALGKPVIAFDLPETRFSAGPAAVYAPANDERAFADHLVKLIDDPLIRKNMGTAGQERVRSSLAWEYSALELVRAYRDGLSLGISADRTKPDIGRSAVTGLPGSPSKPLDDASPH